MHKILKQTYVRTHTHTNNNTPTRKITQQLHTQTTYIIFIITNEGFHRIDRNNLRYTQLYTHTHDPLCSPLGETFCKMKQ